MNYYELLEIQITATEQDIKIAYRKLAKKYHPDLNKHMDGKKMQEINQAYNTLINPDSRKQYDLQQGTYRNNSGTQNDDPFSYSYDFYKAGGFDNMWEDMMRRAAKDWYTWDGSTTQQPPKRRKLTTARIKRILREDLENRKTYQAYRATQCNLCTAQIHVGELFYFIGDKQKMCNACKQDILSHL